MKQTFVCYALALASIMALTGCAQDRASRPSYIGLTGLTPDANAEDAPASAGVPSPATRYVQSNKVLGAMAFHRVTGRTIDPSRLSGE